MTEELLSLGIKDTAIVNLNAYRHAKDLVK